MDKKAMKKHAKKLKRLSKKKPKDTGDAFDQYDQMKAEALALADQLERAGKKKEADAIRAKMKEADDQFNEKIDEALKELV